MNHITVKRVSDWRQNGHRIDGVLLRDENRRGGFVVIPDHRIDEIVERLLALRDRPELVD